MTCRPHLRAYPLQPSLSIFQPVRPYEPLAPARSEERMGEARCERQRRVAASFLSRPQAFRELPITRLLLLRCRHRHPTREHRLDLRARSSGVIRLPSRSRRVRARRQNTTLVLNCLSVPGS